ncbi:MAG TPA: thioredoxin [Planctomycetaceae bacterium]|nr:thioredoxin [Planctomycetaceae bacterium]
MAENVLELTDSNFSSEVLESDQPVLVDFWATWCGPCKMIAPTIEELASDYHGKARIGKVDIDQNQEVAMIHGIQAIPTILIFKDGKVVKRFQGVSPKAALSEALDSAL